MAFKEFLTIEGERLLARSIAGEASITFTRMVIGDGDHGTDRTVTELQSQRMTLDIYSVTMSGDNQISIVCQLDSKMIGAGFYFREKGLYATDGETEILMIYGTAGTFAEFLENNISSYFKRMLRTIISFSNEGEINITLQDGLYATPADVKKVLDAVQNIKLEGDWSTYTQLDSLINTFDTFAKIWTEQKAAMLDEAISSRAAASSALSNSVWTDARAAKLDSLDAAVSSRAAASTALSNAVWTNTRAAKLDSVDTTVSSRAAASTALSNAVWTNARAAKLDNLDTTVSSRAAAATALSNAVWTDYRASYLDYLPNATFGLPAIKSYIDSIIATLASGTATVSCVRRIISGTLYISESSSSGSASISPECNPSKCMVILMGAGVGTDGHQGWASLPLYTLTKNKITVSVSYNQKGGASLQYQIIEFY